MKFADPKNDIAFKKIFGDEKHKSILISFLNSVLDFKEEKTIVDVSLANPYQVPRIPELKETILDIKAINQKGESFIVEMQKKDLGDFTKRSLYYTSKAYVAQLPKGNDYTVLKKVYFIGILNFNIFENKNYISRHLIINQETNKQDLEDFEFSFIELPKFNKELNELTTILDKWIYFLKNASDLTIIPQTYQEISEFQEAFEIVTQTTWDLKELEVYEYIALKEFDELNALRTAEKKGLKKGIEQGIEKGIEQGIEKGIEQGIEKGIEQGIEKGIEQGIEKGSKKKQIEIAKNLLDVLDDETIAQKTGLSYETIKSLRV
jgi:predicted transposase/invertase (TIGR01784 family)